MKQQSHQSGLYVVATPIGCLADWSYRAIEVLKLELIPFSQKIHGTLELLLDHYHIDTPLKSFHCFNERHKSSQYVEQLLAGQSLALIEYRDPISE